MSDRLFGWDYPPGAANDPRAPYNQGDEPPCWDCDHPHDIHEISGGRCLEDGCECKEYEHPDDMFEEDDELDPDWMVEPGGEAA